MSFKDNLTGYIIGATVGVLIATPKGDFTPLNGEANNLCEIYQSAAQAVQEIAEKKNLSGDVEIRGADGQVMCRIEHGVPILIENATDNLPEADQASGGETLSAPVVSAPKAGMS